MAFPSGVIAMAPGSLPTGIEVSLVLVAVCTAVTAPRPKPPATYAITGPELAADAGTCAARSAAPAAPGRATLGAVKAMPAAAAHSMRARFLFTTGHPSRTRPASARREPGAALGKAAPKFMLPIILSPDLGRRGQL